MALVTLGKLRERMGVRPTVLVIFPRDGRHLKITWSVWAWTAWTFLAAVGLGGAIASLVFGLSKHKQAEQLRPLVQENMGLRGEMALLATQLEELRVTFAKVGEASEKVDSLKLHATPTPREEPPGVQPPSPSPGASLSSPSDVQGVATWASAKQMSLQYRELFEQVSLLRESSQARLSHLEGLLEELHAYRVRLQGTPTMTPVQGSFSSLFGWRKHPVTGRERLHKGVDIAAQYGSPIRAAAAGKVTKVASAEDYGIFLEITHPFGVRTRYAHASKVVVRVGEEVDKGQIVGHVGMTGQTTGPHLHFEIEMGGKPVDPVRFMRRQAAKAAAQDFRVH